MSDIWIPDSLSQLQFLPKPLVFLRGILPDLFRIILSEPFSSTITIEENQFGRLLEIHQQRKQQQNQQRERAWRFLSQHSLSQYIWLIGEFPEPLIPSKVPLNREEEAIVSAIRFAYQSIQPWLCDLTQCDGPKPIGWKPPESYKPLAELFIAQLKLATAVWGYRYKQSNELCQLFTSPEHLWFWCQVAICRQNLKGRGLEKPLLHTEVKSKGDLMKQWNDANKMRKNFEEALDQGIKLLAPSNFFENLDRFLEGEAMQIATEDASWNKKGGPWLEYIHAQERARDRVRHEKDLQSAYLYQFPEDTEIRVHLTEPHQKLPKPSRNKKKSTKGFSQKRGK